MKKYLLLSLSLLFLAGDCEPDEPEIINPEEVITTLTYTLTPDNGGDVRTFIFRDLDGDGGNAPVITADALEANTVYSGIILLENEQETPTENITEEVEEEDEDHQLFYQSTVSGTTVTYTDTDNDGNPVGIATSLTTGDAGSGTLTIILRHEPNKDGANVADGNITNAGGETDIEVEFNLIVN